MTEQAEFKTLEDGSIDYAHYARRGRQMRSAAIWRALRNLRRRFRGATKRPAPRATASRSRAMGVSRAGA